MDKSAAIQRYNEQTLILEKHLADIKQIVETSGSLLEGNSFYYHQSINRYNDLFNKQVNLFWCGQNIVNRVCEIGFNAGHSALLMLLGNGNNPIDFTIFDIAQHGYMKPSLNYIKSQFPKNVYEFIEGDSTIEVSRWINDNPIHCGKYDVVHVDGGHTEHCIRNDIKNASILVKRNGLIIIDDTNVPHINKYVNEYIQSGNFYEEDILETKGYRHRIIRRIH